MSSINPKHFLQLDLCSTQFSELTKISLKYNEAMPKAEPLLDRIFKSAATLDPETRFLTGKKLVPIHDKNGSKLIFSAAEDLHEPAISHLSEYAVENKEKYKILLDIRRGIYKSLAIGKSDSDELRKISIRLVLNNYVNKLAFVGGTAPDIDLKIILYHLNNIPALTHLDLSGQHLCREEHNPYMESREHLRMLGKVLGTNTTLTTLVLRDTKLNSHYLKKLIPAFESNTTLTALDLSDNKISCSGIFEMFEENLGYVQDLNLSGNRIGINIAYPTFNSLAKNTSLTRLDLSHCDLRASDATSLALALKDNTTLTWLNLSSNCMGDGVSYIAESLHTNSTLTSLSIRNNINTTLPIGKALTINSSLTHLSLSLDKPAEGFFNNLALNTTLSSLHADYIFSTPMDDSIFNIANFLSVNTSLTSLSGLRGVSDEGSSLIKRSLLFNSTLTKLSLASGNWHIGETPIFLEEISRNEDNSRLRRLTLFELLANNVFNLRSADS